ncbi:lipoyl(octanoyl) transferase LipB [Alicyclobacillus macrosporangiidus]|uniref:Octanoyltransferase n=1 Tax=Alicyclobacillus macrosporangiidus TaxID=392015 RepID=A0A1I7KMT2_9BACL|nr:lipoyl(octanoyl) transferase LipB [Alicyclobacillus macrosporangiidus]SFU98742.1 lipoyl(octanoyl) transferase [Alicyclobacillus macrosporangiidus]
MSHERSVRWVSLGRMDYDEALAIQTRQAERLLQGEDEAQTVFAVEHPPTITVGRSGTFDHILAGRERLRDMGVEVREVDRGGDVTYHGPGQWVLYPVLHLAPWGNDIGRYVRMLEEVVIRALAEVGITGDRVKEYPGVWVGRDKVCAIGVRARRRTSGEFVTYHGLALNVNTNLAHFNLIVPCGIADRGVTSVQRLLGREQPFSEWEARLRAAFNAVFLEDGADVDVAADEAAEAR